MSDLNSPAFWCDTYVTPHESEAGHYCVQWQFPAFTYTCTTRTLDFAQAILAFVGETQGNPEYRDTLLPDGSYRYIEEKVLDLSAYFIGVYVGIFKLGSADDDYMLRFRHHGGAWLKFDLRGREATAFLDGIREVAEHACP
jgi:hypothetical protein